MKAGFVPDSISTDLHVGSMNAGMKDMLNVMGKFLAMGMSLEEVVQRSTWNPARQIRLEQLGNLSAGAPGDVAVLRVEKGAVGFVDSRGARVDGTTKLVCEMTVRNGSVVYDLNGMSRDRWDPSAPDGGPGDPRWDGIAPLRRPPARSPNR
jgi:dihydroorotase